MTKQMIVSWKEQVSKQVSKCCHVV